MATLASDTFVPVSHRENGVGVVDLVRQRYGATPAFWGRYFKRPGFAEDYNPRDENAILRSNGIRLLPIARQTGRVAGTAVDGAGDAILNVDAFAGSLRVEYLASVATELAMFLDVEGTSPANPNLSTEYWIGWSAALVNHSRFVSRNRFTIFPGVYCRQNQTPTWNAIIEADSLSFPCFGAWVFRMRNNACTRPIPDWDPTFNMPAVPLPCPVMIWQF